MPGPILFLTQFGRNVFKSENKIFLCAGVSLFGAVLNFISVCVLQSTIPSGLAFNPYGMQWFTMIYYFLVPVAVGLAVYYDKVQQYRIALVGLVSVSLSYIPSNMHQAVIWSNAKENQLSSLLGSINSSATSNMNKEAAAGGLALTGLFFYIVPMFCLLAFIGSDQDSALNKLGSTNTLKETNKEPVVVVPMTTINEPTTV